MSRSVTVSEPSGRDLDGGRRRSAVAAVALVASAAALAAATLYAYETDQYSNRLLPISDAAPELDRAVNEALRKIAERWRGGENRRQFAFEVYTELGGLYWVDRIERYAMKSPAVEKLPQARWHSIFRGAPIRATRVNWLFGIGDTIRIGDTLLGTDKLGRDQLARVLYGGRVSIVEANLDECILCALCLAVGSKGAVRVLRLYDNGALLEPQ